MRISWIIGLFVLNLAVQAASLDILPLLKKGRALSVAEADALEAKNAKKSNDEARILLLSYYSAQPAGIDLGRVKEARARHILWLIEKDPQKGLGLFQYKTGVARIHCSGDSLADPEAYRRASDLWKTQIVRKPSDLLIREEASSFMQDCEPEEAGNLVEASPGGLGRLYANAVLGVSSRSYESDEALTTDAKLRESVFAQKARKRLEEATDKDLVRVAAISLNRDGAKLWAAGKLDWDYSVIGRGLIAKAKLAFPDDWTVLTLPVTLPKLGQPPPITVRVGGDGAKLVQKVTPVYPPEAKFQRIEGSVVFDVLLGLDGGVMEMRLLSGPPLLQAASRDAVAQWKYAPTLFNGRPCYVITKITVNYELSSSAPGKRGLP